MMKQRYNNFSTVSDFHYKGATFGQWLYPCVWNFQY